MKKLIIALLVLVFPLAFYAQDNMYWVKLKDKEQNSFSLSNPSQFLSQRSIERRTKQNISLNETDLPLTGQYVDSINLYATSLVHRLKWFNMVVVKIDSDEMLDAIKALSFVDTVGIIQSYVPHKMERKDKFEAVKSVDQSIVYPNQYGAAYSQIRMMNGDLLHQLGYKGQGIVMAMMDNGFENVQVIEGFDSVRPRILYTWDFVHNQGNIYTDGGHGTNTFSCVAGNTPGKLVGTAPGASFYLFQTEENGREWVMEEYNWAASAELADSFGVQLFSTSLGYDELEDDVQTYQDLTGDKTIITRASNMAAGKGILVINSAGNEGSSSWHYIAAPADGDSVLAIGAVDSAENLTGFSSRGPNASGRIKPDLCAQGTTAAVFETSGNIALTSGTSFSCPILAGCVASLWSAFPDKTAQEIKEAVMVSADRFWAPDNDYGYGIPNFYNAYLFLKTNYNGKILRLSNDVVVFPNPFRNELNVSLYSSARKSHTIEIFDLNGKKVYNTSIFMREETFDIMKLQGVSNLASGQYILRLDGLKEYSHRIMKF